MHNANAFEDVSTTIDTAQPFDLSNINIIDDYFSIKTETVLQTENDLSTTHIIEDYFSINRAPILTVTNTPIQAVDTNRSLGLVVRAANELPLSPFHRFFEPITSPRNMKVREKFRAEVLPTLSAVNLHHSQDNELLNLHAEITRNAAALLPLMFSQQTKLRAQTPPIPIPIQQKRNNRQVAANVRSAPGDTERLSFKEYLRKQDGGLNCLLSSPDKQAPFPILETSSALSFSGRTAFRPLKGRTQKTVKINHLLPTRVFYYANQDVTPDTSPHLTSVPLVTPDPSPVTSNVAAPNSMPALLI